MTGHTPSTQPEPTTGHADTDTDTRRQIEERFWAGAASVVTAVHDVLAAAGIPITPEGGLGDTPNGLPADLWDRIEDALTTVAASPVTDEAYHAGIAQAVRDLRATYAEPEAAGHAEAAEDDADGADAAEVGAVVTALRRDHGLPDHAHEPDTTEPPTGKTAAQGAGDEWAGILTDHQGTDAWAAANDSGAGL